MWLENFQKILLHTKMENSQAEQIPLTFSFFLKNICLFNLKKINKNSIWLVKKIFTYLAVPGL